MIKHNTPVLNKEEQLASIRVLKSGWLAQGEEVRCFEDEFCDFLDLQHGHSIAVSNGTSALYLALRVLNASGKKVAFPAYVCAALRNAVALNNASECLIDNLIHSVNISIDQLNASNSIIAIVPHSYGIPANVPEISGKLLIEDCCQSLGAKINGTFTGLFGEIGVFSFYATKLMTSGGQGGMIVSKNEALIKEIKDIRKFDQRHDKKVRFNFQMTDLQAAIGRVQLKKLPAFLNRRNEIFEMYKDAGLDLFDVSDSSFLPVRYRAIINNENPKLLMEKLFKNGIKTIIPLEDWELLGKKELYPNAYEITKSTLSLPIYPSLKDSEIKYIIKNIKSNL